MTARTGLIALRTALSASLTCADTTAPRRTGT